MYTIVKPTCKYYYNDSYFTEIKTNIFMNKILISVQ